MSSLTVKIEPKMNNKDIVIKMDALKFEKFTASLGLFSAHFLKSLACAENDYKKNKICKIKSLRELRK